MIRKFAVVAALLLTLTACGSDSTGPDDRPAKVDITGTWKAPLSGPGASVTMVLVHNTTNNSLSGNGTLVGPGGAVALTLTGNFAAPNVSITMQSAGFESMNFTGLRAATTLTGTLNGSGFVNEAVTFTKQ